MHGTGPGAPQTILMFTNSPYIPKLLKLSLYTSNLPIHYKPLYTTRLLYITNFLYTITSLYTAFPHILQTTTPSFLYSHHHPSYIPHQEVTIHKITTAPTNPTKNIPHLLCRYPTLWETQLHRVPLRTELLRSSELSSLSTNFLDRGAG